MILGITGGIASGKSTVSRLFESLGIPVVSADDLAREIVRPGTETLDHIIEHFGEEILTPFGELDRKKLAEKIFADNTARQALNRLTHPAIAALAGKKLRALAKGSEALVIYEAPLLFEAGAEKRVDAVLVVKVDKKVQLERLMERDNLSEKEALSRIQAQMSQEEKIARADYVIDNSGPVEETKGQVVALLRKLSKD